MKGYAYLATPMDAATPATQAVAQDAHNILTSFGIPTFWPRGAWNGHPTETVHDANLAVVGGASVLAAILDGPTIGCIAELQYAHEAGIPTVVLSTEDRYLNSPVVRALASVVTPNTLEWAEAVRDRLQPVAQRLANQVARIAPPKLLYNSGMLRHRGEGDAGFDMYVTEETVVPPRDWAMVPCGVKVAPPPNVWMLIVGRSSTSIKRKLIVMPNIIDTGFRGELFACTHNPSYNAEVIRKDERIAQLVPFQHVDVWPEWAPELPTSERGTNGMGSSGT